MNNYSTKVAFHNKIFLSLLIASVTMLVTVSGYFVHVAETRVHYLIGKRAEIQAKQIAAMPTLTAALKQSSREKVNVILADMLKNSDATSISLTDSGECKPAYLLLSVNDASSALFFTDKKITKPNTSLCQKKGSFYLRAHAPIIDNNNNKLGDVYVLYGLNQLNSWLELQFSAILIPLILVVVLILYGTYLFSIHIREKMLNMEPRHIANLLAQQQTLFESVYEGLIAFDSNTIVTGVNQTARKMLHLSMLSSQIVGKHFHKIINITPRSFLYSTPEKNKKDEIITINNIKVIASRMTITVDGEHRGWVISFRGYDDINMLSMQLSQANQHADNLRAVQHEHSNKISIITGLLHLKRYDQVIDILELQAVDHQKLVDTILSNVANSHVAGLLVGKFFKAKELGLELNFDPACRVNTLPDCLTVTEWLSIIGNLLENAYDAVLNNEKSTKQITCLINTEGDDIIISVSDDGAGIDENMKDLIFDRGVTSKNISGHGIGLWLVKNYVTLASGYILIEDNTPQGTIVTVYIPKT